MSTFQTMEVFQIPALKDNYIYVLRDAATGTVAAVDPSAAEPVLKLLRSRNWPLHQILNTHHHWDHTGGNLVLKAATGCSITGFAGDQARLPGVDHLVAEGGTVSVGSAMGTVLEVPGHTSGHVAYYFASSQSLFCGDTLFSCGCGRLFEGTAGQLWASLEKLMSLPDDTRVYCGHEYTEANVRFALSLEPESVILLGKQEAVKKLRAAGMATVPSLLGDEKRLNPFLKPRDGKIMAALGLETSGPVKVFGEMRRRKDVF